MKPASFTYHRPTSLRAAIEKVSELGEEAKLVAGGQSLVPMMSFRLARPEHLVDLTHIDGLAYIEVAEGELRIGALATHHAVETADLGKDFAVVARAMSWVGHLPIRTRGTVGGSLAHGDAAAEWCNLAVLLDARMVAEGPDGRREIAAEDMFLGPFMTSLEPYEVLVEVVFPRPAPRAALVEYADRRGDFAIVAVAVDLDGDPAAGVPALVVGGIGAVPHRVVAGDRAAEALRAGGYADFAAVVAEEVEIDDEPGFSTSYRRGLVATLIRRACEEASA